MFAEDALNGNGAPAFAVVAPDHGSVEALLNGDACSAALAFVNGDVNIRGDIIAAVRQFRDRLRPGPLRKIWSAFARFGPAHLETYFQSKTRAARNIRFHYDVSNDFYRKFLDSRLIYSSAIFTRPDWTLEQAQLAKLNTICRRLDLRPGENFLDVGCGWGALVMYAAEQYRVRACGCTLSHNQYQFATHALAAHGLGSRTNIQENDYRNITGPFRKISSIGMFEHVGLRRLPGYFRTIHRLLEDDGLFLNSGITRPQPIGDDPETDFLQKEVFPGGDLVHLSDITRDAENAGFEILGLQNIRLDYARTCREWVTRLQSNAASCVQLTGQRTFRIWLLYLAASVVNFEAGQTEAYQILMAKRRYHPTSASKAPRPAPD